MSGVGNSYTQNPWTSGSNDVKTLLEERGYKVNQTQYGKLSITLDNGKSVEFDKSEAIWTVMSRIEEAEAKDSNAERREALKELYDKDSALSSFYYKLLNLCRGDVESKKTAMSDFLVENKANNINELKNQNYDKYLEAKDLVSAYDTAKANKIDADHKFMLYNGKAFDEACSMMKLA